MFGGSCLPKDTKALVALAKHLNLKPKILKATLETNEEQPIIAISLAEKHPGSLKGKKIGILGLSFKPKYRQHKGSKIYNHHKRAAE
ncbi:MAG: hypothetical protein H5T34_01040 [Candidatus Methanomethyliales bacterium]|nr:hypothetical protein [Candidatus Methanomethylicales archaeon]